MCLCILSDSRRLRSPHTHTQVAISLQGAENCGCKVENDALDKRAEMYVELNNTEMHQAALDLQSQYIHQFEESDAVGAAELKPEEGDREEKADEEEQDNGERRRLLSDDADEEDVNGGAYASATKPPKEAVLDVVVTARGAKEAARIVQQLTIEKINAALAAAGFFFWCL